ncbi:hypothetical protein J3R83DRAFT_12305 [Lanmaoa asiatica]|nr:hypothetical protein J3R83DRAFT_12305 [Lanmaoa asiatica]
MSLFWSPSDSCLAVTSVSTDDRLASSSRIMFAHCADRRSTYKAPPTTFTDKLVSQEARREKVNHYVPAQRRAQKFDSSRQLDAFAHLSLGASDDEGDEDIDEEPQVIREGIANYASLAGTSDVSSALASPRADDGSHLKKKRSKNKRRRTKKPSKWANRCMYAELLEMKEEPGLWDDHSNGADDGLPSDLEKSWVAVAPVPTGKRCLAITHQSTSGVIGISPNTTLRSRLLGKMLLPRFPSSLPPLTVLDCILDVDWRTNGILHVLDVIKWKGQDIADCETPFRFWWRDTRLAELPKFAPPSTVFSFTGSAEARQSVSQPSSYHFQYPTSFIPIPYHTDTTLPILHSYIVPLARSTRQIFIDIPTSKPFQFLPSDSAMLIDSGTDHSGLTTVPVDVTSDGLLLYVSRASYEEGISPLSCWIPIKSVIIPGEQETGNTDRGSNGPLDLFQRLVHSQLAKNHGHDNHFFIGHHILTFLPDSLLFFQLHN